MIDALVLNSHEDDYKLMQHFLNREDESICLTHYRGLQHFHDSFDNFDCIILESFDIEVTLNDLARIRAEREDIPVVVIILDNNSSSIRKLMQSTANEIIPISSDPVYFENLYRAIKHAVSVQEYQSQVSEREKRIKVIEKQLIQRSGLLRSLLQIMPLPMIIMDEKYVIIESNSKFLEFMRVDLNDIIGKNKNEVFPEELIRNTRLTSTLPYYESNQSRSLIRYEWQGEERVVEVVQSYIIDDSGNKNFIEFYIDFTDYHAIQVETKQAKNRLEQALFLSRSGVWEYNLDAEEIYLDDNTSFLFLGERRAREIKDQDWIKIFHSNDRKLIKRLTRELKGGTRFSVNEEFTIVNPEGHKYFIRITGNLLEAEDDARVISGIIQNQNELHEAQRQLVISEDRYRNIVENAHEGIVVLQREKIVFINSRGVALLGFDPIESESNKYPGFMSRFDSRDRYKIITAHVQLLNDRNQQVKLSAIRTSKQNNTIRWLDISGVSINWNEEQAIMYLLQDATEAILNKRKSEKQKDQLIHADRLSSLGVLVAGVAHEINNPNNYINLNATILKDAFSDIYPILDKHYKKNPDFTIQNIPYEKARRRLPELSESILEGAERIATIVKNLKEFAAEQTISNFAECSISKLIQHAIQLLDSMIKKATSNFVVYIEDNLPIIYGNERRLEQVIVNLLQNACDAITNRDQGIYLSAIFNRGDNMIIISIRDQGIGINEIDIKHIMDPFYTTKREEGGTGLGLSVSLGIVKEHNGTLSFESTPGEGTTALLTIPAYEGREKE